MSVACCPTCKRDYWRYPGAPPKGYCSVPCKEARKKPATKAGVLSAESPTEVMAELRTHLREVHNQVDPMAWPRTDCKTCEGLESRYAQALIEAA